MSPTKWIENVNAIGIVTKAGRYGGTYAHSDIALEFASWVSAEFKLYIMKDYQRLKRDENSRLSLNWNLNREIAKLNYRIHTDAIKDNLIPPELTPEQISYKYANEADLLNVALFGRTAKQWRDINPGKKGGKGAQRLFDGNVGLIYPDFNRVQFEAVKNEAGLNRFVMTPTKWIEQMNAIAQICTIIRENAKQ